MKRKTTEQFKKEIFKLVGNEYTILNEYKNCHTKIKFKHNFCNNTYEAEPNNFLKGNRCPYCFGSHKKTTEEFKKEVYSIFKDEYSVLGNYKNNKEKILMRHNICKNKYYAIPNNILSKKYRCPYCFGSHKKTTEEFKKEVYSIIGNEYTILNDYKSTNSNIKFFHNTCKRTFMMTPNNFINQEQRCPYCYNSSKAENKIRKYLSLNNINFKEQVTFKNCKYKRKLKFDFQIFFNDYFILLEYDGKQHYKKMYYSKDFSNQQIRDTIKNKYCRDNNITLIRISYKDYNNIEKIINRIIKEYGSTTIEILKDKVE